MTASIRRVRPLLAVVVTLALVSCRSLVVGAPPHLYRVSPASQFPPGLPHVGPQLLIEPPLAPAGLDTRRIALTRSPVSIDYFADSEWTDSVPNLVQTALVQSFENSGAITAIDRESAGLRADFVLKPEIREFEAAYRSPTGPPDVEVRIDVRLVRMPEGTILAHASFARHERAAANDVTQIVQAFDRALSDVLQRIVVWTLRDPALSRTRR